MLIYQYLILQKHYKNSVILIFYAGVFTIRYRHLHNFSFAYAVTHICVMKGVKNNREGNIN